MRSIRDFKPDEQNEPSATAENTEALYDKYSGLSEAELMTELMRAVASGRADGSFSDEQLDEFVGFVSPSLDENALAKLRSLVKTIKGAAD